MKFIWARWCPGYRGASLALEVPRSWPRSQAVAARSRTPSVPVTIKPKRRASFTTHKRNKQLSYNRQQQALGGFHGTYECCPPCPHCCARRVEQQACACSRDHHFGQSGRAIGRARSGGRLRKGEWA